MGLDAARARAAIGSDVATPLALDLARAAWGIHEVINEDIARAFRMHAVERGFDCRRATMVAFGGGGPLHAAAVARKLKVPRIVFPIGAGVMSALGLLASPASFEIARSYRVNLSGLDAASFTSIFDELVAEASGFLLRAGVGEADIAVDRRVDLRYRGQGYELEIPLPMGVPAAAVFAELPRLFAARYEAVFRVGFLDEPLEIVTWKVEARAPAPIMPEAAPAVGGDGKGALKGRREAYLPEAGGFADIAVYDRYALRIDERVVGPALIEERESTCLLRTGDVATVDRHLNLVAEIGR
jgi:N-methylhydantoinase A